MELMGARTIKIKFLRDSSTGYPLILVWSRGTTLRQHKMKRELRIGRCYVDFGNDLNWVIEIDGSAYHQDVVADFDREAYMREFIRQRSRNLQDLRLLRIPAARLWNDAPRVQQQVIKFLVQ